MRAIRVGGYEFHFIGGRGSIPYLRMANPYSDEPNGGYIGSVDGVAEIKKLRDYLTKCLKEPKP